jgi:LysR family positive regulator for ilvC
MDLHSLWVFLTLSETLHFGRASQACNMSPSALSRAIRRLEEETGGRLFLRDNRSVRLTSEGAKLRLYAREALDGWESFKGSLVRERRRLTGEIRLYCSVAAAYTVLSPLFAIFRQAQPGIRIRLQTGDPADSVARVQSGESDITVAARPRSLPRSLRFKTVAVTPLVFIAPAVSWDGRALLRAAPIPWSKVPLVVSETGLSRARIDAWFRAKKVKPSVYAEVSGHEAIVSMVRLGCGVGVVPFVVVERFARKGEIMILEAEPALEPYEVGLCANQRRLALPLVKAFWDSEPEGRAVNSPGS